MQKHQEWLNNRIYQQHLHCLTKIKENNRKSQVKSATHCRRKRVSHHHDQQDNQSQVHQQANQFSRTKPQKTIKFTAKQKQLLWNNFLLGKRIMETSPVINAKKQQNEYKKYKKILDWRIERNKKYATNTDFRNNKLKQFQLNTFRITNTHRLETTARSRLILCLKIANIQIYRPCHCLEDICVKMRVQGKKSVQSSEMVNHMSLPYYEFIFKYFNPKEAQDTGNFIQIEIYQVKGLQQRHIGGFLIDRQNLSSEKICLMGCLQKNNKTIGQISYQSQIINRKNLKELS